MGLKYLLYKILSLGEDNIDDLTKLGLTRDDIKILNLVNYYSLFFALFMYLKLLQLGSKNEFIFLFSFIASMIYVFMIVSGNLRNTFYLILATPILSLMLFNTFIYNPLNGATSSLIAGVGLLYLFFIVYFFRNNEPILILFLMLSIFILLFATTVSNLLINSGSFSHNDSSQYNNFTNGQDDSLININHLLSFFLSIGVFFIYYINVRTIRIFTSPLLKKIKNNMKHIQKMKVKEENVRKIIKKHNANISHLKKKKREYEAFSRLNQISLQEDRLEVISSIFLEFLNNCNLFAIYQRKYKNTYEFESLVLYSNLIKQKNKSLNLKNSLYKDVIMLRKKILIKEMPLKFISHSRNIIQRPICLYLFPIKYGKNIYEILEFCVEKELTKEEEKTLIKMISYLSCTLENIRLSQEYKTLKRTLSEVLSTAKKNSFEKQDLINYRVER